MTWPWRLLAFVLFIGAMIIVNRIARIGIEALPMAAVYFIAGIFAGLVVARLISWWDARSQRLADGLDAD